MAKRKETAKGRILNRAELAEFMGISLPTVDKWVRDGCPVENRPGRNSTKKQYEFYSADVIEWRTQMALADLRQDYQDEADELDQQTTDQVYRRKLKLQADIVELELREKRGELVRVEDVTRANIKMVSACRRRLLSIPSKLARQLTDESNTEVIHAAIEREVCQALHELSRLDIDADILSDPGGDETPAETDNKPVGRRKKTTK